MQRTGPIIVIEDDAEDQELLEETFKVLNYPNRVIFFSDGYEALHYLETAAVSPFLIISDINMPRINGLQLKKLVEERAPATLREVPYIFLTTGAPNNAVDEAFSLSCQGFFIKPNTMNGLQQTIKTIVSYWQACYSPRYTTQNA